MQQFAVFSLFLVLCLSSVESVAQDDRTPWWKKLFKKETVEQMEKDTPTTGRPIDPNTIELPPAPEPEDSMIIIDESSVMRSDIPGNIHIYEDPRIRAIDSLYIQEPPSIMGYRIKIYFGDLSTARSERARFISTYRGEPCYLRPYPPNFAVLVGDFRTSIAAHRRLAELKSMYPSATVVQDEIQLPAIEK